MQSKEKEKEKSLMADSDEINLNLFSQSQSQSQSQKEDESLLKSVKLEISEEVTSKQAVKPCLRRRLSQRSSPKAKKTVGFRRKLDNNSSLDSEIRERVEHNLKYNDDTIFDNLEIFQDVDENNHKLKG